MSTHGTPSPGSHGPNPTDFHAVGAEAFDRLRAMTDEDCREAELALFQMASGRLGAPDSADEVLEHLKETPHRAFRYYALSTLRALSTSALSGGKTPAELREAVRGYLARDPAAACGLLRASDMDRYRADASGAH